LFGIDLLWNKSNPEGAADRTAAWVISKRELWDRLNKEKEARELKEKLKVSDDIYQSSSPDFGSS